MSFVWLTVWMVTAQPWLSDLICCVLVFLRLDASLQQSATVFALSFDLYYFYCCEFDFRSDLILCDDLDAWVETQCRRDCSE